MLTTYFFLFSWVEQDPLEILRSVTDCLEEVAKQLKASNTGASMSQVRGKPQNEKERGE